MRQKRAKTYKRLMALYTQTFGFRAPVQVLVSNDILTCTSAQQLDIVKQLGNCVQGEIKPMITQCCVEALYKLGKDAQRTTNLAKGFERRRCNHREAVEPDECLKDMLGPTNKHRYILATQSASLRPHAESIPGTPIVHFNARGVLVLGAPSTATVRAKNAAEEERRKGAGRELEGVEEGVNVVGAGAPAAGAGAGAGGSGAGGVQGGKRRVKGVNPLSVRKKKVVRPTPTAGDGKGKRAREEDGEEGGDEDGPVDGSGGAAAPGDAADGQEDGRKKKKKRKRSKKSEVAVAIRELNAMNESGAGEGAGQGEGGEESD